MKKFLAQEKDYLLTTMEVEEFENLEKLKLKSFTTSSTRFMGLFKKWKRKVNDQEFLKLFTTKN
jgi:hypothetical protein